MLQCAERGIELAVFPETAVSGYCPTIGHGRASHEGAEIEAGLNRLCALCASLKLAIVVGSDAWTGLDWVNRLYAFGPDGHELAHYDKVHLTNADTAYYRTGREGYPVFTFRGVRVGLAICYDARFPESYRALLAQGVEVVAQGFYGAGDSTWKVPVLGAHLRSRAAENGCFVVAANVAGPLQIVVSQMVDPLGLMLAEANQDRDEIIYAELDLARVAESEVRADLATRFGVAVGR